jgi:hypothetical protein
MRTFQSSFNKHYTLVLMSTSLFIIVNDKHFVEMNDAFNYFKFLSSIDRYESQRMIAIKLLKIQHALKSDLIDFYKYVEHDRA